MLDIFYTKKGLNCGGLFIFVKDERNWDWSLVSNILHYSDLITELFFRKHSGTRPWEPYNGGDIAVLHPTED